MTHEGQYQRAYLRILMFPVITLRREISVILNFEYDHLVNFKLQAPLFKVELGLARINYANCLNTLC